MKEFHGTKGPWIADGFDIFTEDMDSHVCIISSYLDEETEDSNSNLIAAAPELLEALMSIIRGYEGYSDAGMFDMLCHGDEIEKAVKAIAKALGESK